MTVCGPLTMFFSKIGWTGNEESLVTAAVGYWPVTMIVALLLQPP